jgi:hypothetical protein
MAATPRCAGSQSCPCCWDGEPCGRDDLAKPARAEDLASAIRTCDLGLLHMSKGTTASAGVSLAMPRDVLELRRASVERGHEVRHHPSRTRSGRRLLFA